MIVVQHQRQAVLLIQRIDRAPQSRLALVAGRDGLRMRRLTPNDEQGVEDALQPFARAALAQAPTTDVHRNAIQPGAEGGFPAKPPQRFERGHQRILRRLLGFGRIIQDGERQPEHLRLMRAHQRLGHARIAGAEALD